MTIVSRGFKIDLALLAAAYIQIRLFKCGLYSNAALIECTKLYSLKVDWPLFAAAYIPMRLTLECGNRESMINNFFF